MIIKTYGMDLSNLPASAVEALKKVEPVMTAYQDDNGDWWTEDGRKMVVSPLPKRYTKTPNNPV